MSIHGHLARVIEANRISGVKAYGEYEGITQAVCSDKIQILMQRSLEASRNLNELMRKEAENANSNKK
jgi:hypothetical protein